MNATLGYRNRCATKAASGRKTKTEATVSNTICSTSHPLQTGSSIGISTTGAGRSGSGSSPGSDNGFGGEDTRFQNCCRDILNLHELESTRKREAMPTAVCSSRRALLVDLSDEACIAEGAEKMSQTSPTTPQASNSAIEAFFDLPLKYSASACPV